MLCYFLLLIYVQTSKYPSSSSKNLKTYCQKDDTKINIDEPDNLQCTKKRTNNKSKVRNVTETKGDCNRVAIQVFKNGIVEVISDKETMV